MSPHFCKVGRIKADTSKLPSVKELEKRIKNFVDDISKVEFPKDMQKAV
ncbi:hypothetical protein MHTCC0001_33610 [Flavobacteriaceae bacterium MHTCC 0001]